MRESARVSSGSLLKSEYFRVPVDLYQPGDLIEEDLYFLYQGNYLLYRLKNLIWKAGDRPKLKDFEVDSLFVRCKSERDHHRFLESKLARILDEPAISSKEKADIIYSTSKSLMNELFERPDSPEILKRSMNAVQNSITYLNRDNQHFFDLMNYATASFSEFTHGLHVAAYSITLAKQLGIRTYNQISAIGIAAILHDIGKIKISPSLLEKPTALTEEERKEIEKHSLYSYEIVHQCGALPALSEMLILQHHEKPNGTGYPSKLSNELHQFAKIISISDCFDLLTSDRSYKRALNPADAIEFMRTEAKEDYDQNLLMKFIEMLKR